MEKINFEDLPSTDTPIDSANLNLLQTNIENAINVVNQKLTGTVLWTNNDDTTVFANQTISINLNNYAFYQIYYKITNSDNFYAKTELIKKGHSTILNSNFNDGGLLRIATRKFNFQSNGNMSVSIGEYSTPTGNLTTNNGYLIPVEIIGYN